MGRKSDRTTVGACACLHVIDLCHKYFSVGVALHHPPATHSRILIG